jgi:hypothetical protein
VIEFRVKAQEAQQKTVERCVNYNDGTILYSGLPGSFFHKRYGPERASEFEPDVYYSVIENRDTGEFKIMGVLDEKSMS